MEKPAPSINLLHDRTESLADKFLKWALSVGRTIVIVTEIIALSAFLYRFSLDRKIVDLKDEIEQKQLIVEGFENEEVQFRNLQDRINAAKRLDAKSAETTSLLHQIVELATGRIRFNSLSVTEDVIRIDGETPSTAQLNYFIKQLKQHPKVKRVSLDKLDNKTSRSTIEIGVSAYLTDETKKQSKIPSL